MKSNGWIAFLALNSIVLSSSLVAHAENVLTFVPQATTAQQDLVKGYATGHYDQALAAWPKAFEGTEFSQSDTGKALFALLLYKNGLSLTGLENVFAIAEPKNIDAELRAEWQESTTEKAKGFDVARIQIDARWKKIFDNHPLSLAEKFPSFLVKNVTELKSLEKRASALSAQDESGTWLRWQIALNSILLGRTSEATRKLSALLKEKQSLIGADQIHLTMGRAYYQSSEFKKSIAEYSQVPKASEYWFEALEEQAWAHVRLNQPDKAISKLATLMSPIFQTWVGPETFFLANYNNLKVCDYNKIFKNDDLFKTRHAQRLADLQTLMKSGANSVSQAAIDRMQSGELNFMAFAKEAQSLPRFFWRDEFLRRYSAYGRSLQYELTLAMNLSKGTPQSQSMAEVLTNIKAKIERTRKEMAVRMQTMAKSEVSEYSEVVQKLNIIEAEIIQRMYMDDSLKGERPSLSSTSKDANILTFPANDELWIDEIDSFQAQVKSCPQLKEAKL